MTWPSYAYRIVSVVRVVDGDTVDLKLDLGFHLTTVLRFRLLGINTPERGEPGADSATHAAAAWLADRPVERLAAITRKSDSFGRWLANVVDVDTDDTLSDHLLDLGLAVPR